MERSSQLSIFTTTSATFWLCTATLWQDHDHVTECIAIYSLHMILLWHADIQSLDYLS